MGIADRGAINVGQPDFVKQVNAMLDETQPILIRATAQVTGAAVVNEAKCDVLLTEFAP